MRNSKSIAIIGEGETEWFYIDALRVAMRYPFKIAPDFPQHSDIQHLRKLIERCLEKEYDYVICLVDMDRLLTNAVELTKFNSLKKEYVKKKYSGRILLLETNPCTEFWFLLHFLPIAPNREYANQEEVIRELQTYLPGYEKTKRYFIKSGFYNILTKKGNLSKAITNSERLYKSMDWSATNKLAYSQIHLLFQLFDKLSK